MRAIVFSSYALAALSAILPVAYAQGQPSEAIKQKLESEYQLTKTTEDKSDIVTAGSVLVLQKDKLLMLEATSTNPCRNVYRDGAITQNGACQANEKMKKVPKWLKDKVPGASLASNAPASRVFVTGEKFWVTKIEIRDSGKEPGIIFNFFTDAIKDTRYGTSLLIPFGTSTPTADDALKMAEEVITVAPSEDAKQPPPAQSDPGVKTAQGRAPAAPAPQAVATPEPAPAPLEAPPPPPADPTNIAEGQTIDDVVKALGPPLKSSKIGTKTIYFYKDMKITFIGGKVKDVQ